METTKSFMGEKKSNKNLNFKNFLSISFWKVVEMKDFFCTRSLEIEELSNCKSLKEMWNSFIRERFKKIPKISRKT